MVGVPVLCGFRLIVPTFSEGVVGAGWPILGVPVLCGLRLVTPVSLLGDDDVASFCLSGAGFGVNADGPT
jgi:hypothetical protein